MLTKGKQESIFDITVVYVKDSTNREVTDTNGNERLDWTSQVSIIKKQAFDKYGITERKTILVKRILQLTFY
ncbi:hypothetical protein [Ruminiclostridium cellulolyticum]|uniref:hypothetical protein n=1 Tax=Ruminiclostridium cellulolyticum TaxID=1521 RepID=UPI0000E8FBB4|nr:hypothetical protein [Ruminiclostridium cellulolyticum]